MCQMLSWTIDVKNENYVTLLSREELVVFQNDMHADNSSKIW